MVQGSGGGHGSHAKKKMTSHDSAYLGGSHHTQHHGGAKGGHHKSHGHQKKPSGSQGPHGMLHLPHGGQAYAYAAQIKEAAERGVSLGAQHLHGKGAKHHGHRKHLPVAIDTFNIVSNRRTSLIGRVNEATEIAKASSHQVTALISESMSRQRESIKDDGAHGAKQKMIQKNNLNVSSLNNNIIDTQMQITDLQYQTHQQLDATAIVDSHQMDQDQQISGGGLILPDIISLSKSGMSHQMAVAVVGGSSTNHNITPNQQNHLNYQHRGSNSFSGVSGKQVLTSVNEYEKRHNRVLSEKGDFQGRRISDSKCSTINKNGSRYKHPDNQGVIYNPSPSDPQPTTKFILTGTPESQELYQVNLTQNQLSQVLANQHQMAMNEGNQYGPPQQYAIKVTEEIQQEQRPEMKRRATGILHQGQNRKLDNAKAQSQLNSANITQTTDVHPNKHVIASIGHGGHSTGKQHRRIQNIISPIIQDISPNQVNRRAINTNNLMVGTSQNVNKAQPHHIAYASALENKTLHQSVKDSVLVSRYPPLHSEHQLVIDNSLCNDSSMQDRKHKVKDHQVSRRQNNIITFEEPNPASTGLSHRAQMPESRIHPEDLTPMRGTDGEFSTEGFFGHSTKISKENGKVENLLMKSGKLNMKNFKTQSKETAGAYHSDQKTPNQAAQQDQMVIASSMQKRAHEKSSIYNSITNQETMHFNNVIYGADSKEGSAQCRVDTDLSGQAFVTNSHMARGDQGTGGSVRRGKEDWDSRSEEMGQLKDAARTNEEQAPTQNASKPKTIKPIPQNLMKSEDQFSRKGPSYLQNNLNGMPSHQSETSDEEEDEEEEVEEDQVSIGNRGEVEMINRIGRGTMYPQQNEKFIIEAAKFEHSKSKKRHGHADHNSQTQYGFFGNASSHYQQMNNTQVGGITGAGGATKEKRKGKRHRKQNTHHHYHIDFNFEQVNNILVSYGGLGLQQSLKNSTGKKGHDNATSKANVSMSMGHVQGQYASNPNQTKGGPGNCAPYNTNGAQYGHAGGPVTQKRAQMQQQQYHPQHAGANNLLLPELIINKNKINFNGKQYRVHAEDHRVSNRQLKEAAQNVTQYHLAQQMMTASNRTQGGGPKSKKKKHKKNASQFSMPFDEFQHVSGAMTQKKQVTDKYRTPKRPQMSQSLNPGLMNQQIQQYQQTDARNINIGHLDQKGTITFGRSPQDSIKVLRQSQVDMHNPVAFDPQVRPDPSHPAPEPTDPSMVCRGALSKGSQDDKDSNKGGGDRESQMRERPTNKVFNTEQKARHKSHVTAQGARRDAEDKWLHGGKSREKLTDFQQNASEQKININYSSNMQGVRQGAQFTASSATKGGTTVTSPTMISGKMVNQNQGNMALRQRQKQPLHVITKNQPHHGQSQANVAISETPKRFFNVKAHNRGGSKARLIGAEQHSAGLRSGKRNLEPDEAAQVPGGHGINVVKGTYNTLSQISSVVSGNGEKDGARRGSETGSRTPFVEKPEKQQQSRGGGYRDPRAQKVKTIIREQEKKLKQMDATNRRTHQLLEQFNNKEKSYGRQQSSVADLQMGTEGTQGVDINRGGGSPSPKKPEEKLPKPKITDFELEGVIGIGNFGKVHKAYNKRDKRVCALKVLRKESVAQMKHVDHIINELEVLQYLSERDKQSYAEWLAIPRPPKEDQEDDEEEYVAECPFLMHIYSTFKDQENLYFELEYIQGCTLFSQIRLYNQFVQKNMTFYAIEVLLALSYLHSHSIVYRDLKPENLVISMTERGHIKMVDFGFAKKLSQITQRTYTNCGTPAYIAPEILIEGNGHGSEVDIWSFGVLMCEIVSGQTPFYAESTLEVYENINKCQPVYNKLINQILRDLLNKVFVKDPEVRITLDQMKEHRVFSEHDWSIPVKTFYRCGAGPFKPQEAMFNEKADRESEKQEPAKPKNILAAIMGNPLADDKGDKVKAQKDMNFDEMHYNKFEREEERARDYQEADSPTKRKRQNPLGDFKFVKINELF